MAGIILFKRKFAVINDFIISVIDIMLEICFHTSIDEKIAIMGMMTMVSFLSSK